MYSIVYILFLLALQNLALAAPGYWAWCDPTCPTGPVPNGPPSTSAVSAPVATSTSSSPPGNGSTSQRAVTGTGQQLCSAEGQLADGSYTLMANIWGATSDNTNKQCVQAAAASGNGIAWTSTWHWSNGGNIKSFANANGNTESICKPPNSINSVPTTWSWSYDNTGIVADVAYDIFLGGQCNQPGGGHQYEIMLWLGVFGGQQPIGYGAGSVGTVQAGGHSFSVYKGPNPSGGIQTVYSLLPTGGNIQSFTGDLKDVFTQLTKIDPGVGTTSLVSIQAGTEAAQGSATFSVSEYSISGS